MTRVRAVGAVVLLAVVLTWSILRLIRVQFSAGGFYPDYSSLRADPRGTKLLFDSLSRLSGLRVARNYMPLDYFNGNRAAVLLLGLRLEELNPALLEQVEKLARQGNRVVMALLFEESSRSAERGPIEHAWHIRLSVDTDPKHPHPLSFTDGREWTIQEQAGTEILAVERNFGEGKVLLFAESGDFSNEALIGGSPALVTTAIGPNTHVIFDERHFGIADSGSVVGLARRFRLEGLAFGLTIVLALALWKNTSAFPVRSQGRPPNHHTGRTSFEGLVTLLQRHVRPQHLVAACWEEWLEANRQQIPADRMRRAAAIADRGVQRPLEVVREMQVELRAKGEL